MILCVVANPNKPAIKKPFLNVLKWAEQNNVEIAIDKKLNHFLEGINHKLIIRFEDEVQAINYCDIVVSIGGDGTMLWTARRVGDTGKPILGINSGRMGFLANVQQEKIFKALDLVHLHKYTLDRRHLLIAKTDEDETFLAFNEFLFSKKGSTSMITLVAKFDDLVINKYWADGIIISSPTGSTAYNLSLGGPIVFPETEVFTLTPINPHTLTTRPLVLPSNKPITIIVEPPDQEVLFSNDGEICEVKGPLTTIEIKRSSYTINLIKLPGQDYFETLRTKLMWGADFRERI